MLNKASTIDQIEREENGDEAVKTQADQNAGGQSNTKHVEEFA